MAQFVLARRASGLFAILITLALLFCLAQPGPASAQAGRSAAEIWTEIELTHMRGDLQAERTLAESLPEPDRTEYFTGQANAQKSAGPSGGGPYIGINGATCAYTYADYLAAATDGDTIYIYNPPVGRLGTIDKNLTFVAATSDCTAEAAGGMTITGDNVAITYGGVAEIASSKTVTFRNLGLTNNGTATYGGILYVHSNATVILDNSDVYSGSASSRGGGIRLASGASLSMSRGSTVYDNQTTGTGLGGGIASYYGTIILNDTSRIGNTTYRNHSIDNGGGVYLENGTLNMYNNSRIAGNYADGDGGGVYALKQGRIYVHDSASIGYPTLPRGDANAPQAAPYDNQAFNGGGVFLTDLGSEVNLSEDSGIYNNYAGNAGGGIYATASSTVTVDSASINGNVAYDRGGGLIVFNNVLVNISNASWMSYNTSALDGAICIAGDNSTVNVNFSNIYWNSAAYYGAIRMTGSSTLNLYYADIENNSATSGSGGALGLSYGTTTITAGAMQNNTALYDGGAIYHNGGSLQLFDADIRFNDAGRNGGGIYTSDGQVYFWAVNLNAMLGVNTAVNGGGIYATGDDVIYFRAVDSGRFLFNSNNATSGSGGGIYATGSITTDIYGDVQMTSNIAYNHGGGIYQHGGAIFMDDLNQEKYPEIWVNTASNGNGGGIYLENTSSALFYGIELGGSTNGNKAPKGYGGGMYLNGGLDKSVHITNMLAQNNQSGQGGGAIAAIGGVSVFINFGYAPKQVGESNHIEGGASGFCDPMSLPADRYCSEFRFNSNPAGTIGYGGAIFIDQNSGVFLSQTSFHGNTSNRGGAIDVEYGIADVKNSLFTANDASTIDSAVYVAYTDSTDHGRFNCEHCTFADNPSSPVYFATNGEGDLLRSVVWNNTSPIHQGNALFFCTDYDGAVLPGSMNISADPRFITNARGSYRLGPDSPAIDACTAGSGPDLDGFQRPLGKPLKYDMGAFEFPAQNFLPLIAK